MNMTGQYSFKNISRGTLLSETLEVLRFPLAVFILLLHSSFEHEIKDGISIFEGWDAPIYHRLDFIFSQNICNIAVPLFFLMSGFLFFKEGVLTIEQYKNKLRKRIKSLLVPYLVWNVIIFFLYLTVQLLAPSMNTGRNKFIVDYSFYDYLMSFWSMSFINEGGVSGPIDSPLWFIRDLMVMMVISPLFYWLIKKMTILLPISLVLTYIFGINTGIQGFSMSALTFFSLGAYFGMIKFDFVKISKDYFKILFYLYFFLLTTLVLQMGNSTIPAWYSGLTVFIGVFMVIGIASFLVDRYSCKINPFLSGSTFFIFASHSEILKITIRLTSRLGINSDMFYCVAYFVCPLITLTVLLISYWILLRLSPKFASVLSGGR